MAEFGNNIDLSLFDPSQINWSELDPRVSTGRDISENLPTPIGVIIDGPKPTPQSTPSPITSPPPPATTYAVKQPSPSLVTYNAETLPQELIVDLLFEDVGGTELINISRHDTINGQNVVYSLVSNLSILNRSFNPNNILAGQISYSQFSQYSLDIASKLVGISLDSSGNLVIEFSSIGNDEYAEIELSSDGTIYRIGMVVPT
jgi:hypothetical protein